MRAAGRRGRLDEDSPWPSGPEQLLLDAALRDGAEARAAFAAWRARVNLDEELSVSELRLLPLVHDALVRAGETDQLMGRLKGVSRRSWYETRRLLHQVRPAIAAFRSAEIPVLLLDGTALLHSYYRNAALRPLQRIEVCVPPARVRDAGRLLTEAGWLPAESPSPDLLRFRHALAWRHDAGAALELGWQMTYEDQAAATMGWDDVVPVQWDGLDVLEPGPGRLLLATIARGMLQWPARDLLWVPDALTILSARGHEIDWVRFVATACRLRLAHRQRTGLEWLAARYPVPLPPNTLEALRASPVSLAERVEAAIYPRNDRGGASLGVIESRRVLAEWLRMAAGEPPLRRLTLLSHLLRFRWRLAGRREIPGVLWEVITAPGSGRSRHFREAR